MTSTTLVPSRRIHPSTIALALLAGLLLVLSLSAALLWPDKVITIDFVDEHTATTIIPAESVGLIDPACATIDPAAFPCPHMVVVAR